MIRQGCHPEGEGYFDIFYRNAVPLDAAPERSPGPGYVRYSG
ncbi:hypothetical protein LJR130_001037 [Variovorax sp. LjRoot130]